MKKPEFSPWTGSFIIGLIIPFLNIQAGEKRFIQANTITLEATVKDLGGNPIADKNFLLKDNETGSERTVTTDDSGLFHATIEDKTAVDAFSPILTDDMVQRGTSFRYFASKPGRVILYTITGRKIAELRLAEGRGDFDLSDFGGNFAAGNYILRMDLGHVAFSTIAAAKNGNFIGWARPTSIMKGKPQSKMTRFHKSSSGGRFRITSIDGEGYHPFSGEYDAEDLNGPNQTVQLDKEPIWKEYKGKLGVLEEGFDLKRILDDDWLGASSFSISIEGFSVQNERLLVVDTQTELRKNITIGYDDDASGPFQKIERQFPAIFLPGNKIAFYGTILDTDTQAANPALEGYVKVGNNAPVQANPDGTYEMIFDRSNSLVDVEFYMKDSSGNPKSFITRFRGISLNDYQLLDAAVCTYENLGNVSVDGFQQAIMITNFTPEPQGAKPVLPDMQWYLVRRCLKDGSTAFSQAQWDKVIELVTDFNNNYLPKPLEIVADETSSGFYPQTDEEARGKILIYNAVGPEKTSYKIDSDGTRLFVEYGLLDTVIFPNRVYRAAVRALTAIGTLSYPATTGKMMVDTNTAQSLPSAADRKSLNLFYCISNQIGGLKPGMSEWDVLRTQ